MYAPTMLGPSVEGEGLLSSVVPNDSPPSEVSSTLVPGTASSAPANYVSVADPFAENRLTSPPLNEEGEWRVLERTVIELSGGFGSSALGRKRPASDGRRESLREAWSPRFRKAAAKAFCESIAAAGKSASQREEGTAETAQRQSPLTRASSLSPLRCVAVSDETRQEGAVDAFPKVELKSGDCASFFSPSGAYSITPSEADASSQRLESQEARVSGNVEFATSSVSASPASAAKNALSPLRASLQTCGGEEGKRAREDEEADGDEDEDEEGSPLLTVSASAHCTSLFESAQELALGNEEPDTCAVSGNSAFGIIDAASSLLASLSTPQLARPSVAPTPAFGSAGGNSPVAESSLETSERPDEKQSPSGSVSESSPLSFSTGIEGGIKEECISDTQKQESETAPLSPSGADVSFTPLVISDVQAEPVEGDLPSADTKHDTAIHYSEQRLAQPTSICVETPSGEQAAAGSALDERGSFASLCPSASSDPSDVVSQETIRIMQSQSPSTPGTKEEATQAPRLLTPPTPVSRVASPFLSFVSKERRSAVLLGPSRLSRASPNLGRFAPDVQRRVEATTAAAAEARRLASARRREATRTLRFNQKNNFSFSSFSSPSLPLYPQNAVKKRSPKRSCQSSSALTSPLCAEASTQSPQLPTPRLKDVLAASHSGDGGAEEETQTNRGTDEARDGEEGQCSDTNAAEHEGASSEERHSLLQSETETQRALSPMEAKNPVDTSPETNKSRADIPDSEKKDFPLEPADISFAPSDVSSSPTERHASFVDTVEAEAQRQQEQVQEQEPEALQTSATSLSVASFLNCAEESVEGVRVESSSRKATQNPCAEERSTESPFLSSESEPAESAGDTSAVGREQRSVSAEVVGQSICEVRDELPSSRDGAEFISALEENSFQRDTSPFKAPPERSEALKTKRALSDGASNSCREFPTLDSRAADASICEKEEVPQSPDRRNEASCLRVSLSVDGAVLERSCFKKRRTSAVSARTPVSPSVCGERENSSAAASPRVSTSLYELCRGDSTISPAKGDSPSRQQIFAGAEARIDAPRGNSPALRDDCRESDVENQLPLRHWELCSAACCCCCSSIEDILSSEDFPTRQIAQTRRQTLLQLDRNADLSAAKLVGGKGDCVLARSSYGISSSFLEAVAALGELRSLRLREARHEPRKTQSKTSAKSKLRNPFLNCHVLQELQGALPPTPMGSRLRATLALLQFALLPSPAQTSENIHLRTPRSGENSVEDAVATVFRNFTSEQMQRLALVDAAALVHPYLTVALGCCKEGNFESARELLRAICVLEYKTQHETQRQNKQKHSGATSGKSKTSVNRVSTGSLIGAASKSPANIFPVHSIGQFVNCSLLCLYMFSQSAAVNGKRAGDKINPASEAAVDIYEEFCLHPILRLLLREEWLEELYATFNNTKPPGNALSVLREALKSEPPTFCLSSRPFASHLQSNQDPASPGESIKPLTYLMMRAAALYLGEVVLEQTNSQHCHVLQRRLVLQQLLLCGIFANTSFSPKAHGRCIVLCKAADSALRALLKRCKSNVSRT